MNTIEEYLETLTKAEAEEFMYLLHFATINNPDDQHRAIYDLMLPGDLSGKEPQIKDEREDIMDLVDCYSIEDLPGESPDDDDIPTGFFQGLYDA